MYFYRTDRARIGAAVLVAATLSLSACTSDGATAGNSSAATLKLGIPYSETGPIAQFGQDFASGVRMAIDEANAAGGVDMGKGKKIRVEASFCDTQNQTDKAVACGKRLQSQDKVSAMIVGTSLEALPMLSFNNSAAQGKFMLFAGSGVNGLTTQNNPLVARYFFNTATYLPAWTRLLDKVSTEFGLNIKNVGVMETENEFGQGWTKYFSEEWQKAGHTVTSTKYKADATDFYPQLTALLKTKPDAIALLAACGPDAAMIKQARQLGFTGRFLIQVSCGPTTLAGLVQPDQFAGALFEATNFNLATANVVKFKADYKAKYNKDATVATIYGYGEASWAIAGAAAAHSTDPTAIRAALPGVLNNASWNLAGFSDLQESGEVTGTLHITYVKSMQEIVEYTG